MCAIPWQLLDESSCAGAPKPQDDRCRSCSKSEIIESVGRGGERKPSRTARQSPPFSAAFEYSVAERNCWGATTASVDSHNGSSSEWGFMTAETAKQMNLDAVVASWDRDHVQARLEEGAKQRNEFVERFPASVWPDLLLEQYALGLADSGNGFSGWLEYRTTVPGSIKGGSARKHLVYKPKHKSGWYFEKSKYSSESEAWEHISQGFAELADLASQGRWDEIDQIDALFAAQAVRGKTVWMYFPDELLPIYSEAHLDFFLKIFDLLDRSGGPIAKNRRLLAALWEMPMFEGWQTLELMFFLYSWADPNPSHVILKVAPGEGAALWEDCRQRGYMRVGWDELGDLSVYDGKDELLDALMELRPERNKSTNSRAARQLVDFRGLVDGDTIIANRGTGTVVGIGRVAGGYEHRPDLPDHQNVVYVDWYDTAERLVSFGSAWMPTIVRVKAAQYHSIVHDGVPTSSGTTSFAPVPIPAFHLEAEKLLERSGQIILYGPPGTGKTFAARRHSVLLAAGGSKVPEASGAFASADHLLQLEGTYSTIEVTDERPAWLLVANPQHWSWDELHAQGQIEYRYGRVQRNYDEVQEGDVVYGYEATPTKRIVARAKIGESLHTTASGENAITIDTGERVEGGPTWDDLKADVLLAQSEPMRHRMQGTLFKLEPAEAAGLESLIAPSGDQSRGDVPSLVPQLTRVTFHPTYSYEDFIEGYKPTESGAGGLELTLRDGLFKRVCRAASADPDRPYVVVIDEVNRGNVPKIFGELITLIERDKRGVTVTLPQSGDSFQVPPNVFLIGTMNTADRSIHVLDAALRRRFAFLELLPDPEVLEGAVVGKLPLDECLTELNARIREHIGREKQIGHALFLNGSEPITSVEDFALVFKYELLPLLQEYAYGDYSDLALLVGEDIIDLDNEVANPSVIDDPQLLAAALASHLEIGVA